MNNFSRYNELLKVDGHMHYNTDRPAMLELAEEDNFRFVSFNTDIYFFPSVPEQERIVLNQRKRFGNRIDYICTFEARGYNEEAWPTRSIDSIRRSLLLGAVGVKIWKNIGMELRNRKDELVMMDDLGLAPVLKFLEENRVPFTGHLGEPKNCWLPIEQMTVAQDRDYFAEHPEYHMYLHPEFPTYEEQIAVRDKILEKYPNMKFCGAHFASVEWSIEEIAKRLDKFPNMMVDTAERICHLQLQSIDRYEAVRNFVIKYQDRIIYGTDIIDDGALSDMELKEKLKKLWDRHWKYFTTDEMQTSPKVHAPFKGLNLPWEVLEKIYYKNAEKFYNLKKLTVPVKNGVTSGS